MQDSRVDADCKYVDPDRQGAAVTFDEIFLRSTALEDAVASVLRHPLSDDTELSFLLSHCLEGDALFHQKIAAGLKAVGESVAEPLRYFENHVTGTLRLLEAMGRVGLRRLVFSSSATVYGDPASVPIREDSPLSASTPYVRTKLFIEEILRDLYRSDPRWDISLLRYFNPVGAHESGLIGEDPAGIPNNLMPYVSQVAVGRRERLSVWGNDYPTPDGTGVRDYIHVVDLARGHLAALDALPEPGVRAYNLGTGRGYSVLEMISAFEAASGQKIPFTVAARRPGDVAICYADPGLAHRRLGWRTRYDIHQMCRDSWRWQSANPLGYQRPGITPCT